MTLEEMLNSEMDLQSLAALARQGFRWWIDELASMAPKSWQAALSSRPRLWAALDADGGWRFWRDGEPWGGTPKPGASVGLMLPEDAVLRREVFTPRMPAADVRRMFTLDLDRLSPLAPELVHFDLEILDREAEGGKQQVLLGVVLRETAQRLLEAARATGLAPAMIGVRAADAVAGARFDFLPAVRLAAGERAPGVARRRWWWAVAAALAVNLAVLIGRDIADVDRLRAVVESQQPGVTAAQAIRRRVETENARRRDLLARGRRSEPLRMLDALTQAVPASAWVQHVEWNGQTVRLVGFKRSDIDMMAAIRGSGFFVNPRSSGAEAAGPATPIRPFDITADARPASAP